MTNTPRAKFATGGLPLGGGEVLAFGGVALAEVSVNRRWRTFAFVELDVVLWGMRNRERIGGT